MVSVCIALGGGDSSVDYYHDLDASLGRSVGGATGLPTENLIVYMYDYLTEAITFNYATDVYPLPFYSGSQQKSLL